MGESPRLGHGQGYVSRLVNWFTRDQTTMLKLTVSPPNDLKIEAYGKFAARIKGRLGLKEPNAADLSLLSVLPRQE